MPIRGRLLASCNRSDGDLRILDRGQDAPDDLRWQFLEFPFGAASGYDPVAIARHGACRWQQDELFPSPAASVFHFAASGRPTRPGCPPQGFGFFPVDNSPVLRPFTSVKNCMPVMRVSPQDCTPHGRSVRAFAVSVFAIVARLLRPNLPGLVSAWAYNSAT